MTDQIEQNSINRSSVHTPKMVLSQEMHKQVHGEGVMGRLNTFLAINITKVVGSMWCAYLFAVLALISFPSAIRSHDPIIIVAWIAQTFLQLVLLPIIIVGQNVQSATTDARAESDHHTLMAIYTLTAEVHRITERQTKMLTMLEEHLRTLDAEVVSKTAPASE